MKGLGPCQERGEDGHVPAGCSPPVCGQRAAGWAGCTQLLHRAAPHGPKCALGAACGAAAGPSGGDGGKERPCSPSLTTLKSISRAARCPPSALPAPGTRTLMPSPAPERCIVTSPAVFCLCCPSPRVTLKCSPLKKKSFPDSGRAEDESLEMCAQNSAQSGSFLMEESLIQLPFI